MTENAKIPALKDLLNTQIMVLKQEIMGWNDIQLPGKIRTNKDHKLASDATKYLNDKLKLAEAMRKKLVQPLVDEKRDIDSRFKTLTEPLENLTGEVKTKMLEYAKFKAAEQLEYEAKMRAENPDNELITVDDKEAKIKRGEVSTNYIKTTTQYRTTDPELREAVVIKVEAYKKYLENRVAPDWIESYEVESIVVRST